jgi:hypothetical protein
MTPNEITSLIASNLEKELDLPFRLQLMDRVKYWRSRHIVNTIQKTPAKREFFRQALYINLTEAYADESVAMVGDQVSITVDPIPQLIVAGTTLFDYVGGVDGKSPFRKVQPGMSNYASTGKFSQRFPEYEYNQRIFVNQLDLPRIRVDAIYDDPMAVLEYSCKCLDKQCDTWNTEFPCSGEIMQLIVQSILQVDYNRLDKTATPEIEVVNRK